MNMTDVLGSFEKLVGTGAFVILAALTILVYRRGRTWMDKKVNELAERARQAENDADSSAIKNQQYLLALGKAVMRTLTSEEEKKRQKDLAVAGTSLTQEDRQKMNEESKTRVLNFFHDRMKKLVGSSLPGEFAVSVLEDAVRLLDYPELQIPMSAKELTNRIRRNKPGQN